uniref:Uncharacterized protein n=1 Tax=Rhipicephalus appendiculatus TaxID=34631 RepID=A0A131YF51_RHIAP
MLAADKGNAAVLDAKEACHVWWSRLAAWQCGILLFPFLFFLFGYICRKAPPLNVPLLACNLFVTLSGQPRTCVMMGVSPPI